MGDSSGVHVNPVDILLGLNPANGQANVISGRRGAVETSNMCDMWSGIVMLEHYTADVHVRNDVMLPLKTRAGLEPVPRYEPST